MITLMPLTPETIEGYLSDLFDVYYATFALPPWNENAEDAKWAMDRVPERAANSGFHGFIAHDADTHQALGFTYGYSWARGNMWSEAMKRAMAEAEREAWTDDCFEFVELAVAPYAQGHGIGGKLHDTILAATPHRTALLMTRPEATPAMKMYLSRGWQVLNERFKITEKSDEMSLLGKILRPSPAL